MAKGSVITSMQGKLGQMVLYTIKNSNNKQTQGARAYQPVVSNPKSTGQRVQRAVFATVAAASSALSELIDHSFETVSGAGRNRNRFLAENLTLLRARAQANQIDFLSKGDSWLTLNPFIISKGSLPPIETSFKDSDNYFITNIGVLNIDTATPATVFADLEVGSQITVVSVHENVVSDLKKAEFGDKTRRQMTYNVMRLCRITFDSTSTKPAFVKAEGANYYTANPEAVNKALSLDWESMRFKVEDGTLSIAPNVWSRGWLAGAVIQSFERNGVWKYSTQHLVLNEKMISDKDGFNIDNVQPTYGNTISAVFESDKYLQNADR